MRAVFSKKFQPKNIFRIQKYEKGIFVSGNIKQKIENSDLKGFLFTNVEDIISNPFEGMIK